MSLEIVKVTVPSAALDAKALITPQDGKGRTKEQRLTNIERVLLGGDRSGHFKASFVAGKWKLGRRLPDQGW